MGEIRMKIASWNVNGIRAVHKKGLFLPFLEAFQPDILCLQEIKAFDRQIPLDLPDYDLFCHPAERPGYGGTAMLVRSRGEARSIRPPLSVTTGIPPEIVGRHGLGSDRYGDPTREGRVLTAEFEAFHVVSVYTPNAKDDLSRLGLRKERWDPAFLDHVKALERPGPRAGRAGKPVIFCGDLNVAHTADDLARPKPNEGKKGFTVEERSGIDAMIDAGFVDSFRMFTRGNGHYTWWSLAAGARARNVGWRIDYIFVSGSLRSCVRGATILSDVQGSDHCPVALEIEM